MHDDEHQVEEKNIVENATIDLSEKAIKRFESLMDETFDRVLDRAFNLQSTEQKKKRAWSSLQRDP